MYDTHTHSFFSKDSRGSPESLCEAALAKGLKGIAITDHLDYDFPGYTESSYIDFDEYFRRLDEVAAKYAPGLKVLKGVEVGVQPHVIERLLEVVRTYPFDYVLASVHIIDGVDPYLGDYYDGRARKEAYGRYLEEVLFAIDSFPDYDACGHLDYIIRYAPYQDRSMRYQDHADLFDLIFQKLISGGRGLEVNTASYRRSALQALRHAAGDGPEVGGLRTTSPEFDFAILRRYRELGGEIVCLGSDSHGPEYVGHGFEYFRELLKEAGFRYLAHFENRKPVFDPIP